MMIDNINLYRLASWIRYLFVDWLQLALFALLIIAIQYCEWCMLQFGRSSIKFCQIWNFLSVNSIESNLRRCTAGVQNKKKQTHKRERESIHGFLSRSKLSVTCLFLTSSPHSLHPRRLSPLLGTSPTSRTPPSCSPPKVQARLFRRSLIFLNHDEGVLII